MRKEDMAMYEQDVLAKIEEGDMDAYDLLMEADPKLERKWNSLCKRIREYLIEVQTHFPDAQYYTASGGFNLMLGSSHDETREANPQSQLLALGSSRVYIGDGDF